MARNSLLILFRYRENMRETSGRGPRQKISILEQSFGIDIFCCGRAMSLRGYTPVPFDKKIT